MKSRIIVLVFLFSGISFSQNSINYKAVIKDSNGHVIANDLIAIQFSILEGVNQTVIYQENHAPTTNSNGIIIVNIGEGAVLSGVYNDINWGSEIHSLNVQINIGEGLIDMGTTVFEAVPLAFNAVKSSYAVEAATAEIANNVNGLEVIDESNGPGWRLVGREPNNYGSIGFNAVDLSYSIASTNVNGAVGPFSVALGSSSLASGLNSTAIGFRTIASGIRSTAMGSSTVASGIGSISMGEGSEASGDLSTVIGNYTTSPSFVETAFGQYNTTYSPNSFDTWDYGDRLFVVGNGFDELNRSNAFTIFKNGNVAIGNITPNTNITDNVLDIHGRVRIRRKNGNPTAGIWYSLGANDYDQFAGVKKHAIVAAGREWGIYINGWQFWVDGNGNGTLAGNLSQNSDKRLKKDITDLKYGLREILQLQPKSYNWKDKEQEHKSLGLIAQDVLPILKEVITQQDDENKTLSLSYIELIPILIMAIQEQHEIIEKQKEENEIQKSTLRNILNRLTNLEARNN